MIIGIQGLHHAFVLEGGPGGGDVDGATDRVLAEQDALGAFQDLNPLQVHGQRHSRQCTAPGIDAVDIHAHRLLETGVRAGAHTADVQVGLRLSLVDIDVRDIESEFLQVGNARVVDFFAAHRRHGDGHVLQALGPLLGGHDDLFQHRLGMDSQR